MGQTIAGLTHEMGVSVAATLDMGDDLVAGLSKGDVIIDFSSHLVTADVIHNAVTLKKPLIIGTTGHTAELRAKLLVKAAAVPCVWAGNYSVGVNLLNALTQQAAKVLSADYDDEVIEMHHRFKKDAPSGTATRLLETELRVSTADNDINAIKNNGSIPGGYTVNHFLTDTNAWFLLTDVPNGLKHFVRTPLQNSMDGDFDTGNVRYKARERYSFGVSDSLGVFGSPGA